MDTEADVLLVVNGMMRSGTIWLARLLADSLQVACRTIYHDPPHTDVKSDSAIWHFERPGKFIRRLHYFTYEYPYSAAVPQVVIIRDLRDTLVSQAEFYNTTVEARAKWLIPHWTGFYANWLKDERCTTLVRYEALLRQPERETKRVLTDLGFSASDGAVAHAVCDHEFTQAFTQAQNYQKGQYGRSGTWKQQLSPVLVDTIWRECQDVMCELGYDEEGWDGNS